MLLLNYPHMVNDDICYILTLGILGYTDTQELDMT